MYSKQKIDLILTAELDHQNDWIDSVRKLKINSLNSGDASECPMGFGGKHCEYRMYFQE